MASTEQLTDWLKTAVALAVPVIIAPLCIYAFLQKRQQETEIATYPRYTVGEVVETGVVTSPSSHGYSLFTCQVGDSVYTQEGPDEVPKGYTRFLVKFSTQHPTYYKFYERVHIPYYVPAPPPEGWVKLPPELDIPVGAMD